MHKIIGQNLKKSIVVFESTVYPGKTNKACIPITKNFQRQNGKIMLGIVLKELMLVINQNH